MAALTVLVPIYNETEWFSSGGFEAAWETLVSDAAKSLFLFHARDGISVDLRFCLWPSDDDSTTRAALEQYCGKLPPTIRTSIHGAREDTRQRDKPSVVASLELGLAQAVTSSLVMICPVDCTLSVAGWSEILDQAQKEHSHWGVFPKRYAGDGVPLSLRASAWLQNTLFAPILGIHCWTNLFVVPSAILHSTFMRQGFLEDLRANQRLLRQYGRPHRFASLAYVSPRRYERRGPLKQMRANVAIFIRYILGRYDTAAQDLHSLHEGKRNRS